MIKNLHINRSLTRILATLAFAIFMLTPGWGWGQTLYDSYSDGNFTANPVWGGNTTLWQVIANSDAAAGATNSNTLRLNSTGVSTDYLSSQITTWGTAQEWGFFVGRRAQAFTGANQQYFWLYANEATLNNATVDGYRIAIGDDSGGDEIRLEYVVNGAVSATVITSSGALSNGLTDIGFLVRVTRSTTGVWALFTSTLPTANGTGAIATDIPNSTNASVSQGAGTNNTLAPSDNGYIGVAALHSSGANALSTVEFDQIYFTVSSGANDPNLAITGNTAHGSVCPATAASPITYTITNSGTIAAAGISVVSNNAQFVVSDLSSTTIAANGGTATYNVTFTPSSAGAQTAIITVTSTTSGSNSPTSSLTGTGSATVSQTITSSSASPVTAQGATLIGNVTNLGACPAATERGFVYSITATDATPRVGESGVTKAVVAGITTGSYNLALTGLLSSTNYTFNSYVYNGTGYTYGTDRTFTTLGALTISGITAHGSTCPGVSATPQTNTITNNGAFTVEGISVVSGGANAADFVVSGLSSTTINAGATATYQVTFTPASSGSKTATITVSSTTPGIANATSNLTGTGSTPATAAVTTSAATSVTGTTATLNGNLTTLGVCPGTTEKGFVYSVTSVNSDPFEGGIGVTKTLVAGLATGTYNLPITSLTNGTGYSFKAYVYNGTSYTYGNVLTFTTTSPPANDLCSGAIALSCGGSVTVNNALATDDVLPVVSCGTTGANYKGIWFTITPSASGSLTVSTCATTPSFDTYMRIYTGTCGSFTTCVDFNDDGCSSSSLSISTFAATANTTYYILVTSFNSTASGPITISATCPIVPPVATDASAVTSSGFTANWNAAAGATGGYKLDVSTQPSFSVSGLATETEGFNAGTTAPSGWAFTGIATTYTSVSNYGTSSPSLKIDDTGDQIETNLLSGEASELSFWIKGQVTDATSALLVEGFNGSTWVTIQSLSNLPTTGTIKTYNAISTPSLPTNLVKFRFTYTKSVGNLAFDDVTITYNGSVPSFVSGYGDLAVAGTSQVVSGLSPNTTYYYRVRATDGANGISGNSNSITVVTPNPAPTTTTFSGTGNWTTTANWNPGIPGYASEAIIDGTATITTAVEVTNLTIYASRKLIIESTGSLTVTGMLVNSAGNSGLVIKSGGSLISTSENVAATVERAIEANDWHLISSPMTNASSQLFQGHYLQRHTESTNQYTDLTLPYETLTPGKGFALWGDLPTASFTGNLNAVDVGIGTTSVYNDLDPFNNKGWNLVGNPFASSIDWDAITKPAGINDAIYIHVNTSTWATYGGGVGVNAGGTKYIASCQGFFVRATSNATLTIPASSRVHNNTAFFKNSDESVPDLVRLEISGNGYKDESVVRLKPEATEEFDGNWDAYKLFGGVAEAPQIYTFGPTPLAINAFRELTTVPVGVRAGTSGTYTIAATEINDLQNVKLEDTKTGIMTDLTSKSYTFNFTAGENESRFKLHFTALGVDEKETTSANIYSYQQTVYVNLADNTQGDIYIYNLAGQLVTAKESASGNVRIGLTSTGVYMVKVVTQKETLTQKVVIR